MVAANLKKNLEPPIYQNRAMTHASRKAKSHRKHTFFQLVEITHYQKQHWVTHTLMIDIHLDATSL